MSMYKLYAVLEKPKGEALLAHLKELGFDAIRGKIMYVGGGYAEICMYVNDEELSLLKMLYDTRKWTVEEI